VDDEVSRGREVMPIHVDIKINDTLINTIHIGRFSGEGTKPDDVNVYLAVEGKKPTNLDDWVMGGKEYRHRYGDGAEVCLAKALKALGYSDGTA
jgi:hypothetical protein